MMHYYLLKGVIIIIAIIIIIIIVILFTGIPIVRYLNATSHHGVRIFSAAFGSALLPRTIISLSCESLQETTCHIIEPSQLECSH